MIISMTGYGRGESSEGSIRSSVEVRSVNGRFLEVNIRLPKSLGLREKEVKDLIREEVLRGSINVSVKTEKEIDQAAPLKVNAQVARSYVRLLNDVRKTAKLNEKVKLEHLLNFSEIFQPVEEEGTDEKEWAATRDALRSALKDLRSMRMREGASLEKDLLGRLTVMEKTLTAIERVASERVPEERKKLRARIAELVADPSVINDQRLELEVALLADRMDVTEECVRFRSHLALFREAAKGKEAAGRKCSFIVQEMNREANTIGSKVNDAGLQHHVVALKEELERVREQVQNVE